MTRQLDYKVNLRAPGELKARVDNARVHSRKQVQAIRSSIERFGMTHPILIDGKDQIIAGHGRVQAALALGLEVIPTLCLQHLTKAEVNAFMIADNRTAELASWDRQLLAENFAAIELLDDQFDMSLTGFGIEEIDLLADYRSSKKPKAEVEIPVPAQHAVSRLGDLWAIEDRHKVLCADATDAGSYQALLEDERADMVITDPPWNCPVQGHVSGLGKNKHREFVMASGEMAREEFQRFLAAAMAAMGGVTRSGSLHYIFCDWRIVGDVLATGEALDRQLINLAVWAISNAGMGSFLRSQHELVAIFKKGRRAHINKVNLGVDGRHRSNLWAYPGANSFGGERDAMLEMHPTAKPVAMIAEAIKDASHRHDIILDPFGGSGTTLIAAEAAGRRARLMELDPLYVDVIIARAARDGMAVTLASSGQTLDQVRLARKDDDV
jgi:DNA modification methylase